jgi:2-methylisocitrate lyase-like PEP mutase family enzyme
LSLGVGLRRRGCRYGGAMDAARRAEDFLALHHGAGPLLMPNPWDAGSAKVLASLGFQALATTSGGSAAALGRLDGSLTRDEALAHAASIVAATDVPVSADLENLFAVDAQGAAETVRLAASLGLAGCSIEDSTGKPEEPIFALAEATERVAAAAEAAHAGPLRLVLTARAENYLHGRQDLGDTISRLQAYESAGADVLYAPGVRSLEDISTLVRSVGLPLNVLALPGVPPVAALAEAGVRRISVGSGFAWASMGALVAAGTELLERGTYGYFDLMAAGASAGRAAFAS